MRMATRWAICGSGKIANDFCLCLNSLPESEHKIVAVGASSKDKADSFASEFGIPNSYGSYKELAALSDIDVIYISTISINHVELCTMYIEAGKNVLCEKPMALTEEGCQRVLKAAKAKGVLFIEATWSRFFPVYQLIREHLLTGALGDVKMVQATFAVPIQSIPRIKERSLGGGGLMDIGLYTVQAANLVFKGKPEKITSDLSLNETGTDKAGSIILRYKNDCFASLNYSTEFTGYNTLVIYGSKGKMKIPDWFWCPDEVILPNGDLKKCSLPDVKNADKFNFPHSQGLTYDAIATRDCLMKGLKEHPFMPHEDSETIMYICQQVQNQHGIKYDFP